MSKELVYLYKCSFHNKWEIETMFIISRAITGTERIVLQGYLEDIPDEYEMKMMISKKQGALDELSV